MSTFFFTKFFIDRPRLFAKQSRRHQTVAVSFSRRILISEGIFARSCLIIDRSRTTEVAQARVTDIDLIVRRRLNPRSRVSSPEGFLPQTNPESRNTDDPYFIARAEGTVFPRDRSLHLLRRARTLARPNFALFRGAIFRRRIHRREGRMWIGGGTHIRVEIKSVHQCPRNAKPKSLSINRPRYHPRNHEGISSADPLNQNPFSSLY